MRLSYFVRLFGIALVALVAIAGGSFNRKSGFLAKASAQSFKDTKTSNFGSHSVYFEENRGQFDEKVRYFTRGTQGYSTFLTSTEAVYVLSSKEQMVARKESNIGLSGEPAAEIKTASSSKSVAVYMTLIGADRNSAYTGLQPLDHRTNYFKGSDESKWHTDIPNYQSVRANQVYEGIDLIWHGKQKGDLQYDFVVQPNANPNQIEWNIQGAKEVELTTEGDLLIKTEYGDIKQDRPFTYQEINGLRAEVESRYVVEALRAGHDGSENGFRIKFQVGDYDPGSPLTIDPTVNLSELSYSTFLGGGSQEEGRSLAIDHAGNVYITGSTVSTAFPTTPGSFDTHIDRIDVFVSKFNSNGSELIYSTFIGGSFLTSNNTGNETAYGIAIDASGNAFVTGTTDSTDFPTTPGAYRTTINLTNDVFVTKLNPTGSALIYSTYIGGRSNDEAHDIFVDSSGNAFLVGDTGQDATTQYPTTPGAFSTTHSGNNHREAFVTKLNAEGSALVYSTFLGGTDNDFGEGVVVDQFGNAYVTGYTVDGATDFPTTGGAFDTIHNGLIDTFVTKLNADGSALIYSTFVGGSGNDWGFGIDIDGAGNAFVVGETEGGNTPFPTTAGAFDTGHNGDHDVFVTKVNSTGTALVYSTFLGGTALDGGTAIAVEPSGEVIVTGATASSDYPTTGDAFDTTHNGDWDVFVSKFNSSGSDLVYSTYLGGSFREAAYDLVVDRFGNTFFTGGTWDADIEYPTSIGAFDTTQNGYVDAFITKLGANSNRPSELDFDGDGKTDISIFRPNGGSGSEWWYLKSSNGGNFATQFGTPTDKLVAADYTGDGNADIAFWRPSSGEWFILRSEDSTFFAFPFGSAGDVPAPADYDGDGKADAAVFRPSSSTWFIQNSGGGTTIQTFGATGDVPVVADYDGDGKADLAIFRPNGATGSEWWVLRSTAGLIATQFGAPTDRTVPGDYTGDGKVDIAFWRPSTGQWYILRSEDLSFFAFPFGSNGDIPVPGDYDGDGKTDAAVFRPSSSTWFAQGSTSGTIIQQFGAAGDVPVPSEFVR